MTVKGIKAVTVKKRGETYRYYYHRATGMRITAEFGTAAFIAEVARLDGHAEATKPRDGTLHALIMAYRRSSSFSDLAARTRADYDKVFDYLKPMRDMLVCEIDTAFVFELRDKAYAKRKRRFANYVVQVFRLLLEWGRQRGFLDDNPAQGVATITRPKKMKRANRPWTDDERETVLAAASAELRAMIALGMFAGLREGDAVAIPHAAYDGTHIEVQASKNGETIHLPAHFRLREILAEATAKRREAMTKRAKRRKVLPLDPPTLVVSSYGKAWTESGFRASFFKLIRSLKAKEAIGDGLTFHGLRHTVGKLIMEAGGSKEDVAMILGDRSIAMAELYSRDHEKRERVSATMLKLEHRERERLASNAPQKNK